MYLLLILPTVKQKNSSPQQPKDVPNSSIEYNK